MSTWDNLPSAKEMHADLLASLCCMTHAEKLHLLFFTSYDQLGTGTFVEVKRPDKITHT